MKSNAFAVTAALIFCAVLGKSVQSVLCDWPVSGITDQNYRSETHLVIWISQKKRGWCKVMEMSILHSIEVYICMTRGCDIQRVSEVFMWVSFALN